jgi:hypothetical protein
MLEDAIAHQRKLSVRRKGNEYVIVPLRLRVIERRECFDARHPTTGARLTMWIDEIESIEEVR